MGKRYPKEFRDNVVRLARRSDLKYPQLAVDVGVSEASILTGSNRPTSMTVSGLV